MNFKYEINSKDHGRSIKDYLMNKDYSRKLIIAIKHHGLLIINNKKVNANTLLKENDVLKVYMPEEKIGKCMDPEDMDIDIVYEDDYMLVINKKSGIPCIPTKRHQNNTLANGIMGHYKKNNIKSTVHFVNRLDKNTSGLLIIAKSRFLHHLFTKYMDNIKRNYLCVVEGNLYGSGTINKNIARENDLGIKRIISDEGKVAITHYKVLKNYEDKTLIEVKLETGRTHQIRIHMSSIGHPLIGDELYGGNLDLLNRQALHCYKLEFIHPIYKENLSFQVNLPVEIEKALK